MERVLKLVGLGLLVATVAILVSACEIGPLRIVNGSGKLQTERRAVRDFDAVEIRGGGTLVIEQGASESLTIEAEDNLLPFLTSTVEGKRLVLGQDEPMVLRETRPIRYTLAVKDLRALHVVGSADVALGQLQAGRLEIAITGSGDVTIGALAVADLAVDISGSGDVELAGTAATQRVSIAGSGHYRGVDLASTAATVTIGGSGDAVVWASESLKVRVSGSGDVEYVGTPRVDQAVSGSGVIRQRAAR